ncbi:WAT1-related protein At5g47470 [Humulus lupulus]|uniref:WAT1-related protein At5g47470 n=1 Tax=Humulus lupulus TaxID=3486 RepID=UPI002B41615A|nr:WAT1-related protein At5g47470 [Humulus lupulus]
MRMMDHLMKKDVLEEVVIISILIGIQVVYAGNSILMGYLMSIGLTPFTIVIYTSFATFLLLSPIAFLFERSKWPKKFSLKLLIQLVLIAFGGVTLFQSLLLKGINLTSPAMATSMPNLAPGIIFVIAWALRLEKVKLSCIYSKVKIAGTLLCVAGALTMSIMHSAKAEVAVGGNRQSETSGMAVSPPLNVLFDKDKIIGCFYLMAAIFVLSTNVVLQAATLGDFPAPMSLCAITSLLGGFLTAALQILQYHKLESGFPVLSVSNLISYSLVGGVVSGTCVSFNGWAMKKRGPVLVSMFNPIGTVCSVVLSIFTLGESFKLGSLAGMLLMFTGLYFVLWAKGKEGYNTYSNSSCSSGHGDGFASEFDPEKPLLS